MGDHDDQAVGSDLLQDVHDLHAGLGVERTGGFVGKNDFGVVDQGAGDSHALHLTARKLGGLLVHVPFQAYGFEGFFGATGSFGPAYPRKGQRQFDVRQNRLVGNEVVALEDEADAMVAVGVPILRLVILGGRAVDDDVAAIGMVQAAEHVEQGRLARPAGAQNRHEFVVAQIQGHSVKRFLDEIARLIRFAQVFELNQG